MKAKLFPLIVAIMAFPVTAAPPPPPIFPDGFESTVDGYDMKAAYRSWRYWVEQRKGPVTEALISNKETVVGKTAVGAPFISFKKFNDFGHFLSGNIQAYCDEDQGRGYKEGTCHYQLRRAFVPHSAYSYGNPNPVSEWMDKNFDAQALAADFKARNLEPDYRPWKMDRAILFSGLPSPDAILKQNATVVRLDSRNCLAFHNAILEMEKTIFDLPIDIMGVAADKMPNAPRPHSVRTHYALEFSTESGGVSVQGDYTSLVSIVGPVLDAADQCEKEREQD